MGSCTSLLLRSRRKGEPECRAIAHLAVYTHLPSVRSNDRRANIEADAESLARAAHLPDTLDAMEQLPKLFLLLRRKPRPLVAHPYAHLGVCHRDRHTDWRGRRGVFQGVGQIIGHHLGDAPGVKLQQYGTARQFCRELAAWPRELLLRDGFTHHTCKIGRCLVQLECLRLYARDIEKILDQPVEPGYLPVGDIEHVERPLYLRYRRIFDAKCA